MGHPRRSRTADRAGGADLEPCSHVLPRARTLLHRVHRRRQRLPPFVNLSQTRTEQVLDERIAGQPLVEARWGHRVTDLIQHQDHVELLCETADGNVTVRAAYVLACVGARGHDLRDHLGVGFGGRTFGDQFLICDIQADLPGWERERRFYFDPEWNPGRQVLIHPCPDSTYRIDWQVPEEFDMAAEESDGRLTAGSGL
ncbi:FAD-dependent monooxygenase [Streptomyces sp. INA 01156]